MGRSLSKPGPRGSPVSITTLNPVSDLRRRRKEKEDIILGYPEAQSILRDLRERVRSLPPSKGFATHVSFINMDSIDNVTPEFAECLTKELPRFLRGVRCSFPGGAHVVFVDANGSCCEKMGRAMLCHGQTAIFLFYRKAPLPILDSLELPVKICQGCTIKRGKQNKPLYYGYIGSLGKKDYLKQVLCLARKQGPISPLDVSNELEISEGDGNNRLKQLYDMGLIAREPHPSRHPPAYQYHFFEPSKPFRTFLEQRSCSRPQ